MLLASINTDKLSHEYQLWIMVTTINYSNISVILSAVYMNVVLLIYLLLCVIARFVKMNTDCTTHIIERYLIWLPTTDINIQPWLWYPMTETHTHIYIYTLLFTHSLILSISSFIVCLAKYGFVHVLLAWTEGASCIYRSGEHVMSACRVPLTSI